jgi:ornithine decarboxylase
MSFKNISKIINLSKYSYTPIAVFNKDNVISKLETWNKYLPNIKPYYAIKSFSDRHMLNTIAYSNINVGFDVASMNEIQMVNKYKKSIILSNPIKSNEDILQAKVNNIKYIVCDDIDECNKVLNIYPEANIIWRIKSVESYSLIKFNYKFGASFEETINILNYDDDRYDNIKKKIVGLSFHVGSKCQNTKAHIQTIELIMQELYHYFIKNNIPLKIINIGGGFISDDDIIELSENINYYIANNIEYIAEPGRYLSSSSIDLFTRVIMVKEEKNICHIYINDSIYNSFSGKVYDRQEFKPLLLSDKLNKSINNKEINKLKSKKCIIWGNTCDSADVICENIYLDIIPSVGDILYWSEMGSYSLASSCNNFNGFEKAILIDYDEI